MYVLAIFPSINKGEPLGVLPSICIRNETTPQSYADFIITWRATLYTILSLCKGVQNRYLGKLKQFPPGGIYNEKRIGTTIET